MSGLVILCSGLHDLSGSRSYRAAGHFVMLNLFMAAEHMHSMLCTQGKDWTADAVWAHIEIMIATFKAKGLPPPIVNIHNHDVFQHSCAYRILQMRAVFDQNSV